MANTPKLDIYIYQGNDIVSKDAINTNFAQVDSASATQTQVDQPFHLDSYIYSSSNNRIVCTFNTGTALFPGNVVVNQASTATFNINSPATNTTYTIYLHSDGSYSSKIGLTVVPNAVPIWQVSTGGSLSTLTATDIRSRIAITSQPGGIVSTSASTYTVQPSDSIIGVNAGGSNVTVNLPVASGSGRTILIYKSDGSSHTVTVDANGTDTIVGSASGSISTQYGARRLVDAATGLWQRDVLGSDAIAGSVAGGDLSGSYPSPTVVKIQGRAISNTSPATGQALVWNGTSWVPTTVSTGSASPIGPAGGDLTGSYPSPTIDTGVVTSAKLANGAATGSKLGSDVITTAKVNQFLLTSSSPTFGDIHINGNIWLANLNTIYFGNGVGNGGLIQFGDGNHEIYTNSDNQYYKTWNGNFYWINANGGATIMSLNNGSLSLGSGGNLYLGNTGGNKALRVISNTFQIVNNAYTAVLFSIDDSGNVGATGQVSAASLHVGGAITSSATSQWGTTPGDFTTTEGSWITIANLTFTPPAAGHIIVTAYCTIDNFACLHRFVLSGATGSTSPQFNFKEGNFSWLAPVNAGSNTLTHQGNLSGGGNHGVHDIYLGVQWVP